MPKPEEIREIGAGLFRKVTEPGWLWNGETELYQASVPEDQKRMITESFIAKRNREPSEREIQQVYAAMIYKQFYANQSKKSAKEAKNGN